MRTSTLVCSILTLMNEKLLRPYFLGVLIIVSLVLAFFVFEPFLIVLILAAIFAVVLQPVYRMVHRAMRGSPGLAAFVTMLIAMICILVPLVFVTSQLTHDAQRLYTSLSDGSERVYLDTVITSANNVVVQYAPNLALSPSEVSSSIDEYLRNAFTWLILNLGGAFGGIARFLLDLFVFMIALYYMLRDGKHLRKMVIEISPLVDTEDEMVIDRLELAVHSVIRGSLMIALLQGVLTAIGFALFGVPHSILWGVAAAFAALIPGIGTSLILGPAVAYLFIIGANTPAIGLLIWSVFAVGLIDNFLGPKLVGKGMQLHPLLVLLSVFGGLVFFGAAGIFLGPLCISLLFALLSIYQQVSKKS